MDDCGGPFIGLCTGGRCSALWRLRDDAPAAAPALDAPGPAAVREAVRTAPGAVLTSLDCVGACAVGALVGVGDRRPGATSTGEVAWVVGAQEPERATALLAWLGGDWTEGPAAPPAALLPHLRRLVRAEVDAPAPAGDAERPAALDEEDALRVPRRLRHDHP